MPTLDTNVIVRHLTTGDNAEQLRRVRRLFAQLSEGSLIMTLREAVLVETVQVLSSKNLHHLSRANI